jgi:hypothetical protein
LVDASRVEARVRLEELIDLGTQVVAEQSARPPADYAEVFTILGEKAASATVGRIAPWCLRGVAPQAKSSPRPGDFVNEGRCLVEMLD